MARLYYNLIVRGMWTIENVPYYWKADVQALLEADERYQKEQAEKNK